MPIRVKAPLPCKKKITNVLSGTSGHPDVVFQDIHIDNERIEAKKTE